jgi:Bifunctional DNA primase/polymerase, N-terminal/AAA domain/Primase C terminal 1 (PriCT-1)
MTLSSRQQRRRRQSRKPSPRMRPTPWTTTPPSEPASVESPSHATETPRQAAEPEKAPPHNGKRTPKLAYALAYAKYGMRVFPVHEIEPEGCSCGRLVCSSAGKHPRIRDWQTLATCDEDEIRKWWEAWPNANIGVACGDSSGITVLDVDGDEGRATLRELELVHGDLPETPIVLTGSGGCHYYFVFQEGPNNAVRFAPGLDIRTRGGLVVGAGSRNGQGPYVWEEAFKLGSEGLMPARMPQWLIDVIKLGQGGQSAAQNGRPMVPANVNEFVEGSGRNDALYKLGRSLKAQGFSPSAIEAAITRTNEEFKQPFSQRELADQIAHILSQPDRQDFKPSDLPGKSGAPLRMRTAKQFLAERRKQISKPVVWEGTLQAATFNMLLGRTFSGKSSCAAVLARQIHLGGIFLGRRCTKNKVGYFALERSGMRVAEYFEKWGIADDICYEGEIPISRAVATITAYIKEEQLGFIVIDHLQQAAPIQKGNDYANVEIALMPLVRIATETGCCILVLHHQKKPQMDEKGSIGDADEIEALGSDAYRALSETLVECSKRGGAYFVRSETRDLQDLPRTRVVIDFETGDVEAGDPQQEEVEKAAGVISKFLTDKPPQTEKEIRAHVRGVNGRAVNEALRNSGQFKRLGMGGHKEPFRYFATAPPIPREQHPQKGAKVLDLQGKLVVLRTPEQPRTTKNNENNENNENIQNNQPDLPMSTPGADSSKGMLFCVVPERPEQPKPQQTQVLLPENGDVVLHTGNGLFSGLAEQPEQPEQREHPEQREQSGQRGQPPTQSCPNDGHQCPVSAECDIARGGIGCRRLRQRSAAKSAEEDAEIGRLAAEDAAPSDDEERF